MSTRTLALVVGLFVCAAQSQQYASAQSPRQAISLEAAEQQGLIEAEITGSGGSTGDVILLHVKRRVARLLRLVLTEGTVLRSLDATVQNMLAAAIKGEMVGTSKYRPTSVIDLQDDHQHTYVIEAYCLDFDRDNPSSSSKFAVAEPDARSRLLVGAARKAKLGPDAIQAAIWLDNSVSESDIQERFPISSANLREARRLLQAQPKRPPAVSTVAPAAAQSRAQSTEPNRDRREAAVQQIGGADPGRFTVGDHFSSGALTGTVRHVWPDHIKVQPVGALPYELVIVPLPVGTKPFVWPRRFTKSERAGLSSVASAQVAAPSDSRPVNRAGRVGDLLDLVGESVWLNETPGVSFLELNRSDLRANRDRILVTAVSHEKGATWYQVRIGCDCPIAQGRPALGKMPDTVGWLVDRDVVVGAAPK
jgi:hypothetical protein